MSFRSCYIVMNKIMMIIILLKLPLLNKLFILRLKTTIYMIFLIYVNITSYTSCMYTFYFLLIFVSFDFLSFFVLIIIIILSFVSTYKTIAQQESAF